MGLVRVLPTLVLASMLLLNAYPAHAQRVAEFDPSECVIDPGEYIYFSLYGWVFAIDRSHDFDFELDIRLPHAEAFQQQIRDRDHPTIERWPEPLHSDAPMGCPGNPIMTTQVMIEPTYEQLGVPPQTRRHPVAEEEYSELTDERRSSPVFRIRPTRYRLSARPTISLTQIYQPPVDDIHRLCGRAITKIAEYLNVCYLFGENGEYFEYLDRNNRVIFVADPLYYTDPYDPYFHANCRYRIVVDEFTWLRCESGYRINQNLLISYQFFTRNYPVHQFIPLDSAFRAYLSDAFHPELSQPFAGTVEDLRLPTIDHLTLLDQWSMFQWR